MEAWVPRRVLVVDDERSLARVVASYLERSGYTVECAFDGAAPLAAARRSEPHVVVLDLMLPEVGGIEVFRRLRTFRDCYVVMLTARAEEVDKLLGLGVGVDDHECSLARDFAAAGVTILPIVVNGVEEARRDMATAGARTPFLLDTDKSVSRAYGTLDRGMHAGLPGHSFVLIDRMS